MKSDVNFMIYRVAVPSVHSPAPPRGVLRQSVMGQACIGTLATPQDPLEVEACTSRAAPVLPVFIIILLAFRLADILDGLSDASHIMVFIALL